jgi:hypothetical protein
VHEPGNLACHGACKSNPNARLHLQIMRTLDRLVAVSNMNTVTAGHVRIKEGIAAPHCPGIAADRIEGSYHES